MDNQHRKISGYRDLSQTEIDLMNAIKAQEAETAALLGRVSAHLRSAARSGADTGDALRQLAIGRSEFEGAFMRLVRSVAQPATPWVGALNAPY
jgi:hypothetical protein